MNVSHYLKTLLNTLNPNAYKNLTGRPLKDAFNYFFFVVIFSLVVFVLLFIPYVIMVSNSVDASFQKITTFTLDADVVTAEPVVLSSTPRIVLDLNKTNFSGADVLITKNNIFFKPYIVFGEESIDLNELANLKQHQGRAKSLLVALLIFLLPALLVLLFVVLTLKSLAIAIVASVLAFIVFKLTHYNVKLTAIFKTALYASTIMLLLDIILVMFYPRLWIPLAAFLFVFILGSWSIAQKRFSIRQRKQKDYPDKK